MRDLAALAPKNQTQLELVTSTRKSTFVVQKLGKSVQKMAVAEAYRTAGLVFRVVIPAYSSQPLVLFASLPPRN